MVEDEEPTQEVAAQGQRHAALKGSISQRCNGGSFKNERKQLFRQASRSLLKCSIDGNLLLGGRDLLVQDLEGRLLHMLRLNIEQRIQLFSGLQKLQGQLRDVPCKKLIDDLEWLVEVVGKVLSAVEKVEEAACDILLVLFPGVEEIIVRVFGCRKTAKTAVEFQRSMCIWDRTKCAVSFLNASTPKSNNEAIPVMSTHDFAHISSLLPAGRQSSERCTPMLSVDIPHQWEQHSQRLARLGAHRQRHFQILQPWYNVLNEENDTLLRDALCNTFLLVKNSVQKKQLPKA